MRVMNRDEERDSDGERGTGMTKEAHRWGEMDRDDKKETRVGKEAQR
jgi:hypothetical protein